MSKSKLLIILLVIWIVISNGAVFFFWKVTNLGDLVMLDRLEPLVCKIRNYEYMTPYSKLDIERISEEDWATYQRVGTELMKEVYCRKYSDFVWFNLIEESIDHTFEEMITE